MGAVLSPLLNASQYTEDEYDIPSESDVFAVRDILNSYVPLELADTILNLAEYWPCISATCHSSFNVSADEGNETTFCCLITPAIPYVPRLVKTRSQGEDRVELEDLEMDVRRRVKSVIFQISSRDQGWGGEAGLALPYLGSWTWFDAQIWRPNGTPEQTSRNFRNTVSSSPTSGAHIRPMMIPPTDEELTAAGYHRIGPPPSADTQTNGAWLIQRNMRANSRIRTHVVAWSDRNFVHHECHPELDSDSSVSSASDNDSDTPNQSAPSTSAPAQASLPDLYGCGNGAGFVQSLQAGDRIAIMVKTKYPGWENRICGNVKAEIMYTIT